jgi:hypothetical protein
VFSAPFFILLLLFLSHTGAESLSNLTLSISFFRLSKSLEREALTPSNTAIADLEIDIEVMVEFVHASNGKGKYANEGTPSISYS